MSAGATRTIFSIRARLLLVHALLVVLPFAGISFARTYERELLRSEEEGMVALAVSLASSLSRSARSPSPELRDATVMSGATAAAQRLLAQVRVIDASGRAVFDTGPERVEIVTQGRRLLSTNVRLTPRHVAVEDPLPVDGSFLSRPEVSRALQGFSTRFTRVAPNLRGVRLYVAEPVHAGTATVGVVYVSRTTYPVLVSLYRIRNGLIKVALGSLAVAALVALYLGLTISRPLRRLTDAAGRIAAGERGVSINLKGRDEIADLARDFDAMARALDARLAYISELAANVSHEFKTPIASIRGAAELLRDGAAEDPDARARFLGNILDDAERLTRLVTRLLALSRIEANPEPKVPFDYRALVEGVVGRYRAAGREVSLTWETSHEHLRASPEQVDQVLTNLIDNALRFSPAHEPVSVLVWGDVHEFHTRVRDRGPGISSANLPRVWDRFFTTERATGGTGLGLSIVRAIVETHGGRVGVESSPGAGTSFWFTLPRRL